MQSTRSVWWKRGVWICLGLVIAVLLVRAFQPVPVPVDVATIKRDTLRVTVDDDGRTRVRERYTITAPIQGRLLRANLDPGDAVQAHDTVVAEFAAVAPNLLDSRARAEAAARLSRAEAAVEQMKARSEQAAAELDLAVVELERQRQLAETKAGSAAQLDIARRNEISAREGLRAAQFAVDVARFEQQLAHASLAEPTDEEASDAAPEAPDYVGQAGGLGRRLRLRSPIDGRVIRVYEESARPLPAGSPLIEVGNTSLLEIVADYLTQDAVRVLPGMPVFVGGWGGEQPTGEDRVLAGRVRTVEPGGFTKVSALGVEEQRVNIIVDPTGSSDDWAALGDGYRVELRILVWEQDDVVIVPLGALFREGESWAAFVVEDGVARQRTVELGRRSTLEAQVLGGLKVDETVVLYPSELLEDGTSVEPRE